MIHVKFPITATRLFVVVPVALGIIAAQRAIGQKVENPKTALVNVFFHCCLEVKFPNVERSPGKLKAFDPNSGRNFAWDTGKQAWIDTKTLECICPKCPPSGTAQQPTPSTTDKVTDVLKTIGSSVSIGIGGGGGDRRHSGEERHRTADKIPTDKTKTHTTSPTTTHKTVTAGCKCHPCTCSPCTCH
jgi:hypothetical protein